MLKYIALATLALASPAPAPFNTVNPENSPCSGNTKCTAWTTSTLLPYNANTHIKSAMSQIGLEISLPENTSSGAYFKATSGSAVPSTLKDKYTFYVPSADTNALVLTTFGGYPNYMGTYNYGTDNARSEFRDPGYDQTDGNKFGAFNMNSNTTIHRSFATYKLQYLPTNTFDINSPGKMGSTEVMQMYGSAADFMISLHCNKDATMDGTLGAKRLPVATTGYCVIGQGNHGGVTGGAGVTTFDRFLSWGDQFQLGIFAQTNNVIYNYRRFSGDDGAGYSYTASKPYIFTATEAVPAALNPYYFKAGNYCQTKATTDFYCDIWLYSVQMCHGSECYGSINTPTGYTGTSSIQFYWTESGTGQFKCLVLNDGYTPKTGTSYCGNYNDQRIQTAFDSASFTYKLSSVTSSTVFATADSSTTVTLSATSGADSQKWKLENTLASNGTPRVRFVNVAYPTKCLNHIDSAWTVSIGTCDLTYASIWQVNFNI